MRVRSRSTVRVAVAPLLLLLAAAQLPVARFAAAQLPPPPARTASADGSAPARCGTGIPEGESRGYVPLPRGDVFCPLVADPKGVRSFVSYLRGNAEEFAQDVGSVGIADVFGLVRFGGARPGNGVQLSLNGGVFAQFDLGSHSYDLINADYLIGVPLTVRVNATSARLRVYHQSSHLGDEFLLRSEHPERENLSFEALELLLSQDLGPLRVYGGGEYYLDRQPRSLPRRLAHGGVELRPGSGAAVGTLGRVRLVAAGDVKAVSDQGDWVVGVSARAGFEVGRVRENGVPSRRWSLLYEFYDGPSPYGQFFQHDVRLMGVGMHFTP
jgi:hypothetical protein